MQKLVPIDPELLFRPGEMVVKIERKLLFRQAEKAAVFGIPGNVRDTAERRENACIHE